MIKDKGFTFIEILISISILGMLAVVSTTLFFRSIRGSGKSDANIKVEQEAQLSLTILRRFISNSQSVLEVEGLDCPNVGNSMKLLNFDGQETEYTLTEEGQIASNGANISSDQIEISDLVFSCERSQGVPDSVTVNFNATSNLSDEADTTLRSYQAKVNLRNY